MMATEDFTKTLGLLMAEAFGVSDSPSGYFLDTGRDGLLGTIDEIGAELASTALKPHGDTIAAHCAHVLYQLRLFDASDRGQAPEPDWPGSWTTCRVDEAGWAALRSDLQAACDTVAARLQASDRWPEARVAAAMMLLAHCVYHVGQIRLLQTAVAL